MAGLLIRSLRTYIPGLRIDPGALFAKCLKAAYRGYPVFSPFLPSSYTPPLARSFHWFVKLIARLICSLVFPCWTQLVNVLAKTWVVDTSLPPAISYNPPPYVGFPAFNYCLRKSWLFWTVHSPGRDHPWAAFTASFASAFSFVNFSLSLPFWIV